MKKILILLNLIMITFITSSCNNVPASIKGDYHYSNSSWIKVKNSTVDFEKVYLGRVYLTNGTYVGDLTLNGKELGFSTTKENNKKYKFTASKKYNNGYIEVSGYLYIDSPNYINLSNRNYNRR